MQGDSFFDSRPLKSPKRFFFPFTPSKAQPPPPLPPLPPLPPTPAYNFLPPSTAPHTATTPTHRSHTPSLSTSSYSSAGLGQGATVVRTPSEALRGVRQLSTAKHGLAYGERKAVGDGMSSMEELRQSKTELKVLRHQKSDIHPERRRMDHDQEFGEYVSDHGASYAQPQLAMNQRKYHSISVKSHQREEKEDMYRLNPPSSSSIKSPTSIHTSKDDVESGHNKKKHHRSMAPASRFDTPCVGSYDPISTFDPFGTSNSPSSQSTLSPMTPGPIQVENYDEKRNRRSTLKPNPPLRPSSHKPSEPFDATLVNKNIKPSPTIQTVILVSIQFGFTSEDPPRNDNVVIPFLKLRQGGGKLVNWLEGLMPAEEIDSLDVPLSGQAAPKVGGNVPGQPEMTDGSSAEESDLDSEYDLNNLLRDEYLKSLFISSPTHLNFPLPPTPLADSSRQPIDQSQTVRTAGLSLKPRKRAVTRNQYTQLIPHPSPLSPFISPLESISSRRKAPTLKIEGEDMNGGGKVITYSILLCRDAVSYHSILGRLCTGSWGRLDVSKRKLVQVQEECEWLGMTVLSRELELKVQNGVRRGGEGYI